MAWRGSRRVADIELIPYGIMRGFRSLDQSDPYNPYFQNAVAQGQAGLGCEVCDP